MDMDRRGFFKLAGTLGIVAIFGGTLTGCSYFKEEIEDNGNNTEDNEWSKTGNKKTYKAYEHVIWEFEDFDNKKKSLIQSNGEIDIPNGYSYVSSEAIAEHQGNGSKTQGIKYNFVNTVDVEAEEYMDRNGNTAYPIAGTPIDLEKAAEEPKVLIR